MSKVALMPRLQIAAVLVGLGLVLSGCGVNTIPTLDEQAKARWSDVQNQYQRRADLIPNLVETVKGYARAGAGNADPRHRGAREGDLDQGRRIDRHRSAEIQGIPGRAEPAVGRARPPDRHHAKTIRTSNRTRISLHCRCQLEGTENRIAVSRRDYVNAVQAYNTEVRTFPGMLWAMHLAREADGDVHRRAGKPAAPQVKF